MILTTEVGGQRSNLSTMPVPQQWTRVNTLQFIIIHTIIHFIETRLCINVSRLLYNTIMYYCITTLQANHALWKVKICKVKLLWHQNQLQNMVSTCQMSLFGMSKWSLSLPNLRFLLLQHAGTIVYSSVACRFINTHSNSSVDEFPIFQIKNCCSLSITSAGCYFGYSKIIISLERIDNINLRHRQCPLLPPLS